MGSYLDSDLLRRQSNIFLRLTVVTMIGLIGTTTTGFLGMSSLIAATDHHLGMKALYVAVTAAVICGAHALYLGEVATNCSLSRCVDQRTIAAASQAGCPARYLDQEAVNCSRILALLGRYVDGQVKGCSMLGVGILGAGFFGAYHARAIAAVRCPPCRGVRGRTFAG